MSKVTPRPTSPSRSFMNRRATLDSAKVDNRNSEFGTTQEVDEDEENKDLPGVLKIVERTSSAMLNFEGKIECMASGRKGILFGRENGTISLLTFSVQLQVSELTGNRHSGQVTCLCLSPCQKFAVSGSTDKSVKLWSLDDLDEVATFVGHTSRVQCVEYSADGRLIASGSRNGSIKLWSPITHLIVASLSGHTDRAYRLQITPDCQHLISGSWDNTLKLWSLATFKELTTFIGHTDYVNSLIVTPDGKLAISGSEDEQVKVWSLAERREKATFRGHTERVTSLALAMDGTVVLSGSEDCSVKMWSLITFTEIVTLNGHTSDVTCIAVTPDNQHFISGSLTGEVKVWSLSEHCEVAALIGHSDYVSALAVSENGREVVSGSTDGLMKVWYLEEGRERVIVKGHTGDVNCVAVSPNGQYLISGSKDNTLKVWALEDFRELATLSGHSNFINCVVITPDSRYAISGSVDSTIKVWSLRSFKVVETLRGHSDRVYCLVVTPCGKKVISGSWDYTIKVWGLADMKEEGTLAGHTNIIYTLAISPDGTKIVSGTSNGELKVWSLALLREIATLEGHSEEITSLGITSDSQILVSGSWDSTVRLWSLSTFCELSTMEGHSYIVYCVAVTPNGQYVVSGSVDKTLKVWSISERREVATLYGHTADINCVEILPDGRHIASGSMDCSVKLWSLDDMREVATLTGHTDRIYCLAATPDGSRIISGAFDHTIIVHNIDIYVRNGYRTEGSMVVKKPSAVFAANLGKLVRGVVTQRDTYRYSVVPHNFNSLHISAYFNHPSACGVYFQAGVPILRGVFGSPLTVALTRNTTKCIDVLLTHLKAACKSEEGWRTFLPFSDDLPMLLSCNSPLVVRLFNQLLCKPAQGDIPQFIVPLKKTPIIAYVPTRYIQVCDFAHFSGPKLIEADAILVEFFITLFRWNFTPGSNSSIALLKALGKCRNRKVLTTEFVSTLVETKWKQFFPLTLGLTFMYGLLLINLVAIIFHYVPLNVLVVTFALLNCFFLIYECLQVIGNRRTYWTEVWNLIDFCRGFICLAFCASLAPDKDSETLRLIVMALCFMRGFTYFRTFTMTRVFVYMTLEVVKEIYSFLLILAYSLFCFGMLASEKSGDDGFSVSWTTEFNLLVGSFDNTNFDWVQWVIFICSNVLNVVIMMNLLVSILGDAYDKAQMSLRENDIHEMLGLIIEYESLMFWRRNIGSKTLIVRCNASVDNLEEDEWEGRINKIAKSVKDENKNLVEKLSNGMKSAFKEVDKKVSCTEEKVSKIHSEVSVMQEEVNHKLTTMEGRILGVEGKLDRILGILTKAYS